MRDKASRLVIGEGRISGHLSTLLGLLALGGVACFHFPEFLTTPELRAHYSAEAMRWLLLACLVLSFGFAFTSWRLSGRTRYGLVGIGLSALAIVLGGATVEVEPFEQSLATISLDWLLIDVLVLSSIFIPIELFLPQRAEQTKLHGEWRTDLAYFAVSHLLFLYIAVAVKLPAETLFASVELGSLRTFVAELPFVAALVLAMLLADLCQYGVHRAFHIVPLLWRFHAVHHSMRTMDWVAGSRLHLVDILVTRAASYAPLYLIALPMNVFYAYVAIVSLQAVAAHANTRLPIGPLKYLLVTPQFHWWHHSDDPRFHDRNFAIHFPWIDKLFGTYHLPDAAWPERVGLATPYPRGYLRQLVRPFGKDAPH